MNVHMRVTDAEYRKILAEARRQGSEPRQQLGSEGPLYMTMEVKLFVNPSAHAYKTVQINDRTYSRTVCRVEEVV